MFKPAKAITFIELITSLVIVYFIIFVFYSLQTFSREWAISAGRTTTVQNELNFALEHMSKYVQLANGNLSRNAIEAIPGGFRVYVDCRDPQDLANQPTPSDFSDDCQIEYTLSGSTLTASCNDNGGTCPCPFGVGATPSEILTNVIVPTTGFQTVITSGNEVEIGLIGRFYPAQIPVTQKERLANPQVEIKTKLICNNSSAN